MILLSNMTQLYDMPGLQTWKVEILTNSRTICIDVKCDILVNYWGKTLICGSFESWEQVQGRKQIKIGQHERVKGPVLAAENWLNYQLPRPSV